MSKDDNYTNVMLEEINGQMKRMAEVLSTLATKEQLQRVEEDITEIKSDMGAIKAVLREHSTELEDREERITTLEAEAA